MTSMNSGSTLPASQVQCHSHMHSPEQSSAYLSETDKTGRRFQTSNIWPRLDWTLPRVCAGETRPRLDGGKSHG